MLLSMGFSVAAQSHSNTPPKQGEKGGESASKPMEIAEQFISKIEKQLLTADYSIELLTGTQRQQVVSGKLQMLGNCFRMTILSSEAKDSFPCLSLCSRVWMSRFLWHSKEMR